jgi:hypothetical protein
MIPKRPHPRWHELATPEERSKIDELDRSIADLRRRRQALVELDRSIADLRRRRQALVNRTKFRTQVWLEHHGPSTTRTAQGSRAATHRHPRPDTRRVAAEG